MTMDPRASLQVGADGKLRHLLTTEGLSAELIRHVLDTADQFVSVSEREVKKVPILRGKSIFNVFFEGSTRTRTTFEIAAKRLSADVINLNVGASSTSKGETLLDTVYNLQAMDADMFVVRHSQSGAAHLIAKHVKPGVAVINVVGDVLHSRVARSQIHALKTLGVPDLRVVGPKTLLPRAVERLGVRVCNDMGEGIRGCDVVIMLRLQNERMNGALLPSAEEFFKCYGLTAEKLAAARPDAIVMHPGPMNRGVEIDSTVADGRQSVILPQVTFGIAVRMAVMSMLGSQ